MPQASNAVAKLPEGEPQAVGAVEQKTAPETRAEHPNLEEALEKGGLAKVINLAEYRAKKTGEAINKIAAVDAQEQAVAPEIAEQIQGATKRATERTEEAKSVFLKNVEGLLGTPPAPAANENAKSVEIQPIVSVGEASVVEAVKTMPVVAVGDVVPKAEAVQVMPSIKVEEVAPAEQKAPVEKSEEALEADEQLEVATEVMKENYEALAGFAHEHGLSLNEEAFQIAENDLTKLTKPERMYAQVLMGKHTAGRASMLHAEKLLEAYELPEGDPKRIELMKEAQKLANEALVREKGAQVMQQNYMNLPEIMALAGGGGDETGGGYGGANFEAQASPFGGKPQGPEVGGSRGGGMYDVGGAPGTGLTEIKAYKTEGAKVEEPKPSWVDRFVGGNVGKIKDWFGQFGPDGKGRE